VSSSYLVIWQKQHIRPVALHGTIVVVKARIQRKRGRSNILANRFHDLNSMLDGMPFQSRDFKSALGIVDSRMTRRSHGSAGHGKSFL
jgi:hypothetical protein